MCINGKFLTTWSYSKPCYVKARESTTSASISETDVKDEANETFFTAQFLKILFTAILENWHNREQAFPKCVSILLLNK